MHNARMKGGMAKINSAEENLHQIVIIQLEYLNLSLTCVITSVTTRDTELFNYIP